jgi:hypothetical protein
VAFESKWSWLYGVLSCCALGVVRTWAADVPSSEAELDRVIKGEFVGYIESSEVLLGVDEAKILNASLDAETSAASRARAFATQRLLSYSLRGIKWPPNLAGEAIEGVSNSFLRVHQFSARLQGLRLIKSWKRNDDSIRVIVSLPDPEKQIAAIALGEVEKELSAALESCPGKVNLAAYLEFCAESDIPKVVELLAERMGQYGEGVAVSLAGARMKSPTGFQVTSVPVAGLGELTTPETGLKLLGAHPFDPAVCLSLGDLMQKSGHPRMGQLIYSRGASVFVGRAEADECERKAGRYVWPLSFSYPKPEVPTGLIVKLWKSSGVQREELGRVCWLIAESAGHLPVQASAERNENYDEAWRWFVTSPPDLTNALQSAMQSLEEAFTADAANLVGRILMLQGKNGLAAPFLEEARFLESRHPYAQGNLALALYALGEKKIGARIAIQAVDASSTPDSLKKNLRNLIEP